MNTINAPAMRRALEQTRAGNLMDATRLIQEALNGGSGQDGAAQDFASARPFGIRRNRPTRPLSETVEALVNRKRAGGLPLQSRKMGPAPVPEVPAGARYESRHHQSAFGHREYRLFVPSPRDEPVQGLIVMLHGCTQSADDFATGTRMNEHAERHNLCVVYPQQDASANQMSCWNWFQAGHQQRDAGEPALLAGLATSVGAEFGIPAGRIFVAGLSAGGAMAAVVGHTHPDVFAAVGVHSGLARGAAQDVVSAFGAMRNPTDIPIRSGGASVPTIVFHGTADATVHPGNADQILNAAIAGDTVSEIGLPQDAARPGVTQRIYTTPDGETRAETWLLDGVGHAWSGGSPNGSYTHPEGPDASAEMIRFFMQDRNL